jgi:O-antigen ligase
MLMLFNKFIFKINKLLIIIFPFLLITGPFLPDLFCTFIGLTYLFYCLKIKNFEEYKNYIIYFFLIIYVYININSFFSFNPIISFQTSLAYIRIILFIVALSFFFKKYKNLKFYLFNLFCLCLSVLLIDSLLQFFFGYNLIGFPLSDANRISSFFGDKLILGSFLTRLLPFIFALIFLIKLKQKELISLILLLIVGLLVLLSGERLSFIYYFFFILFYFFLNFDKKIIFKYSLVIVIGCGLIYAYKPTVFDRIFFHSYKQFKETNNIIALSYRHKTHFETAYNMFLDNKLLGQGLKSFRYLCDKDKYTVKDKIIREGTYFAESDGIFNLTEEPNKYRGDSFIVILKDNIIVSKIYYLKYENFFLFANVGSFVKKGDPLLYNVEYINGCNTHPHNIYLQFLSELGLLGFFLFSIMFIYILCRLIFFSIKNYKKKLTNIEKSKTYILFGIFLSMIPFLPSGNYFGNWLLIVTYFPIGFYLSLMKFTK